MSYCNKKQICLDRDRQLEVLCPRCSVRSRMFTPKHVGNTDVCEEMFCQRPYSSFFFFSVKTQMDRHVCMCITFINTLVYVCVMYICVCLWGEGAFGYQCLSWVSDELWMSYCYIDKNPIAVERD